MAFPLPRGFVRYFRTVVRIDVIEVFHGQHHRAVSGILDSQVVGDQPSGFAALAFEYTAKEASRGFFVTMARYEHIHDIAALVHGTPQIVLVTLNGDKNLVDVPGITQAPLSFF